MIGSVLSSVVSLLVGILLGLILYGGLWVTLRDLPCRHHHPHRWIGISYGIRMGLTWAGFALLSHWNGQLILGLVGLLVIRSILIERVGVSPLTKQQYRQGSISTEVSSYGN